MRAQGIRELNLTFMAFNGAEASSADWPPDKNAIPGTAAVTIRKGLALSFWDAPLPIKNLRHVLTVFINVLLMFDELVLHHLLYIGPF